MNTQVFIRNSDWKLGGPQPYGVGVVRGGDDSLEEDDEDEDEDAPIEIRSSFSTLRPDRKLLPRSHRNSRSKSSPLAMPTPSSCPITSTSLESTPTAMPSSMQACLAPAQQTSDAVYQDFVGQWCFAQGPAPGATGSGEGPRSVVGWNNEDDEEAPSRPTPTTPDPNLSMQATGSQMNHVNNIHSGAANINPSVQSFVNAPRSYSSTIYDSSDPSTIIPISGSDSDPITHTGPEPGHNVVSIRQRRVDSPLENDLNSQPQLRRPERENQEEIGEDC